MKEEILQLLAKWEGERLQLSESCTHDDILFKKVKWRRVKELRRRIQELQSIIDKYYPKQ